MNADNRRGELADLKMQLGQLAGSRAPGAAEMRRELFKKVLSQMTIGIDVSSLFTEMVMCSATPDTVLKKMCYLYVATYASTKPELALLTINFLQRDCQDDDPMVRGLALRSLCSLRVRGLLDYLLPPLERALKDHRSAYVRAVAVVGVGKLYQMAPAMCREHGFIPTVKRMLMDDPDAQVVSNCVSVLEEVLAAEALAADGDPEAVRDRDMLHSRAVVFSLLNRMKDLSEWSQCRVLDLVSKYVPSHPDEAFDLMNLLEDRLQHANSAVVIAAAKVFLQLTMGMPDVHQQVYERIKTPLLTLVGTCGPEQSFAVVSHLALLVARMPHVFASDYKHMYCRVTDAAAVKRLKLKMLTAVANESNTYDIVTELTEYAADVDVSIAREAIRAVGQIALKSYDVNGIVDRLLQFLEMDTDYVTAETLLLVRDLLRKYPQWSADCLAVIGGVSHRGLTDPRARAALVWMLGEYGEHMADAPYALEELVDAWGEEQSEEVRLELLTAVPKLFFKRPPECHQMLGRVLAHGLAEIQQDLHDRALLYYRLFRQGVGVAERVINPPRQPVSVFVDAQGDEARDRIFDEFNSLSVVYGKPAYLFLDKEQRTLLDAEYSSAASAAAASAAASTAAAHPSSAPESASSLLNASDREDADGSAPAAAGGMPNGRAASASAARTTTAAAAAMPLMDLLSDAPVAAPAADLTSLASTSAAPSMPVDPFADVASAITSTSPAQQDAPAAAAAAAVDPLESLLGLSAPSAGSTSSISNGSGLLASLSSARPPLSLHPKAVMDAPSFQRKWGQLAIAKTMDEKLPAAFLSSLSAPAPLLAHMAHKGIQCMASGGQAPTFRFFFYAHKADVAAPGGAFLVELQVNTSVGTAVGKIKAEEAVALYTEELLEVFRRALLSFGQLV